MFIFTQSLLWVVYLQHVASNIIPQIPAQSVKCVSDLEKRKSKFKRLLCITTNHRGALTYLLWGQDAVEAVQQYLETNRNGLSSVQDQGAQVEHHPRKSHLHWTTAGGRLGLELLQCWRGKYSFQVLYLYKWKMSYISDNLVIKKYTKRSTVIRCLWRPATGMTHLFVRATDVCLPSTHCNICVCECTDAYSRCSHWCDDSDTWLHVTIVTAHICTLRANMTTDILSRSLFSTTSRYKKKPTPTQYLASSDTWPLFYISKSTVLFIEIYLTQFN